jgi:hypothetical protein
MDLDHPLPPEAWVMFLPMEIDIFCAGKKKLQYLAFKEKCP